MSDNQENDTRSEIVKTLQGSHFAIELYKEEGIYGYEIYDGEDNLVHCDSGYPDEDSLLVELSLLSSALHDIFG